MAFNQRNDMEEVFFSLSSFAIFPLVCFDNTYCDALPIPIGMYGHIHLFNVFYASGKEEI